jgi:adenosylcobinamide-phosphate synthase
MLVTAILLDWWLGDPKWWIPHPVILIGKWINWLERRLRAGGKERPVWLRIQGVVLTTTTVLLALAVTYGLVTAASWIHPWAGYAVNTWLIATTLAVKGLKQAADRVLIPLHSGDLPEARRYVGWIVGRDTEHLDEPEIIRATVETVAENTVDAFVSPIVFALLGGAPLAMLYRAANTLDSMVGYKNDKYRYFGWASARFDDLVNWLPARLTGLLLILAAAVLPGTSAPGAARSIRRFSRLHPSPNSGIPESAVAGALGIELGGVNRYFGQESERARMGWPLRPLRQADIIATVRLLYLVSAFWVTVLAIAELLTVVLMPLK